ncbi:lipopolysaccharide biosynthesis protein [Aeromonas veronii]|uniref:lipopolysaccharide biosynthesis protein n=1 Tax=Aeromonas veronii TaxID=654 RepID=UPI002B324C4A|nr:O-antigen translocase [Aeromonas veronii]
MNKINNNVFIKNVLTLMAGTVIAQAVPIAIIPILTRIFTPEDFGLLAVYSAVVSILGSIVAGRYEVAILLPENDEDARVLLQVSVLVAAIVSLTIYVPVSIFNSEISRFLGNDDIAMWLYLIPISVFVTAFYQALTYWNNRGGRFKTTALSRVVQSLFQGSAQTSLGFVQLLGGLIWGQLIGLFLGMAYLLKKDRADKLILDNIESNKIKEQIKKYQKYPKYGVFGALCDASAIQMPVLMLTKFYSSSVTGMFSLTFRILNIPASIISSAIAQVLFKKVVEISHSEPEKLNKYIIKLFILLFITYLPIVPILFIWGEPLFSLVFGQQWGQAGVYAGYLVIAVAIRFSVSPLSAVLGLEQNIKMGVLWQVLYLCTITVTLYFSSFFSIEEFLIAFVVHEVVLYLIYFFLILKGTKEIAKC